MTEPLAALRAAYDDLARIAGSLSEAESWLATGCAGWAVRDLVFHLLGDAQRALVAIGTPSGQPADRTAVSYWTDAPGRDDPDSRGLRAIRTMASAWKLEYLVDTYVETSQAVLVLSERADGDAVLSTQGHALAARDLFATLAVEAAIHHLDLVAQLERAGPAQVPLALVRETLDGLLGHPVPVAWDDVTYALAGTGRRPLTLEERAALGRDADKLPLLS